MYFCADDYGLNSVTSARIRTCVQKNALNKVSVFTNFESPDLLPLFENNLRLSLHLNLVEGTCVANPDQLGLIVDENGRFKHTFGGLFKLALTSGNLLEEQAYQEIRAQVLLWKKHLPPNVPFCIDSHQHTYMIPPIFKAVVRVLQDEKISVSYMRIPAEPLSPYIKTPSLYFTYKLVNLIKQWLLKFLWLLDKKYLSNTHIPTAHFCGILFSGKMDADRLIKILPKYMALSKKDGKDVEVLFHPGYLEKHEINFEDQHIPFKEFYASENRKIEFDSVIKLSERSML